MKRQVAVVTMSLLAAACANAVRAQAPDTTAVVVESESTAGVIAEDSTAPGGGTPAGAPAEVRDTTARAGAKPDTAKAALKDIVVPSAGIPVSSAACPSCAGVALDELVQGHNFLLGWYNRALPSRGFVLLSTGTFLTTFGLRHGGTLGIGAGIRSNTPVWTADAGLDESDNTIRHNVEDSLGIAWAATFGYG
jgi:hypothetical protein